MISARRRKNTVRESRMEMHKVTLTMLMTVVIRMMTTMVIWKKHKLARRAVARIGQMNQLRAGIAEE